MAEVDTFLAAVMPRMRAAETALHNGDAGPRIAMWSQTEPVTLFGAAVTNIGWADVGRTFDWLGSQFSHCESFEYDLIAAGASGDLAYLVGFEHTTASVGAAPPAPYSLRVTTIFRREDGEWKVVHRHGDPAPDAGAAGEALGRLRQGRPAS